MSWLFLRSPLAPVVSACVLASVLMWAASGAQAREPVFDVPAQPLEAALRELARQGNVQVLFSARALAGRTSRAVAGEPDAFAAFATVLEGSGFEVRRVDRRTFVVRKRREPARSAAPRRAITVNPDEPVTVIHVRAPRQPLVQRPPMEAAEREGEVVTLDAADMALRPSRNIGEALARVPGMTVLNTGRSFIGGIDSASRGEGLFTAYRGLNPEFSLTLINGVTAAQALSSNRGVQLSLLPPQGFASVHVHKAGRADMDGDVVSGVIDLRTPNAIGHTGAPRNTVRLTGQVNDRARRYGLSGAGGNASVEHVGRYGAEANLGLYLAAHYEHRYFANSEMAGVMAAQNDNGWAWAVSPDPEGGPPDPARPETGLVLTSLNAGLSRGESRTRHVVASLDWRAGDWEAYAFASHARSDTEQNSTFSQIVSGPHRYVADGDGYALSVDALSTRVWYETNPDSVSLTSARIGAVRRAGRTVFSPWLFYGEGHSNRPDHIEASVRIDQDDNYNLASPLRATSGLPFVYDGGLPRLRAPQVVYDDLNHAGERLLARRAGQLTAEFSAQTRHGAALDIEVFPEDGSVTRFKTGFKLSRSRREMTSRNWTNDHFANLMQQPGVTWADLGLIRGYYDEAFPGLYGWRLPEVDHERLMDYFHRYVTDDSFDTCGTLALNNLNCNTQTGSEAVDAAYVLAELGEGKVQARLGLRYEHTRISSTFWAMTSEAQPGHWDRSHSRYSQWLPSVTLDWRPATHLSLMASLWRSYSRPAFSQLGGGTRMETVNDGVTIIRRGNPDLKAVEAVNGELSAVFASAAWGRLSLSVYEKRLEHYLYEGSDGESTSGEGIRLIMPRNGGRGYAKGAEFEYAQVFDRPFGMAGQGQALFNLSRQWTRVDLGSDVFGRDMPMQNAPDWLGNLILGYRREALSLSLSYTYTGAYLSGYNTLEAEGTWDNLWIRPVGQWDLKGRYRFGRGVTVEVSLVNLTGEYSYWSHVGRNSLAISDVVDSGRRFSLSLSYDF